EGTKVVTVEGLSNDEALTPLQASFRRHHALQCGFCTPGMITTAHALLTEEPDCDADRVREVLSGNLCRCTGYISIVEAVLVASAAYQKPGGHSCARPTAWSALRSSVSRTCASCAAAANTSTTCRARACCTRRSCAARSRTGASGRSTSRP